ncbi:MAG: STAS domain-containing protein [Planctomycetes bacterium]|nr:STAS domain-containing protein [Planctomycetota bacterium]MCP4839564.1 STAS domain-containing protein [Planctomycetota bacterium]
MHSKDHAPLTIDIEQREEMLVIRPSGEIDLASSPQLRAVLQSNLATGSDPVVIDLGGVPYMDSSGVATLVEALQTCRRIPRDLTLARLTDRVASIFKISKLDAVFTVTEDVA